MTANGTPTNHTYELKLDSKLIYSFIKSCRKLIYLVCNLDFINYEILGHSFLQWRDNKIDSITSNPIIEVLTTSILV